AVPDARLRLPARGARTGHRHHPRAGVADHRAAGRPGLGGRPRDGAAARREHDHGPAVRDRGEGHPGHRDPVLPLLASARFTRYRLPAGVSVRLSNRPTREVRMTQLWVILFAVLIGVIAGLRALTAPAAVAWGAVFGWVEVTDRWSE